eukprot:m.412852 g.412852  ORF g.412852 m.412852 type:complete len:332 (-) comp28957_c0_seq1:89-1084(-)
MCRGIFLHPGLVSALAHVTRDRLCYPLGDCCKCTSSLLYGKFTLNLSSFDDTVQADYKLRWYCCVCDFGPDSNIASVMGSVYVALLGPIIKRLLDRIDSVDIDLPATVRPSLLLIFLVTEGLALCHNEIGACLGAPSVLTESTFVRVIGEFRCHFNFLVLYSPEWLVDLSSPLAVWRLILGLLPQHNLRGDCAGGSLVPLIRILGSFSFRHFVQLPFLPLALLHFRFHCWCRSCGISFVRLICNDHLGLLLLLFLLFLTLLLLTLLLPCALGLGLVRGWLLFSDSRCHAALVPLLRVLNDGCGNLLFCGLPTKRLLQLLLQLLLELCLLRR